MRTELRSVALLAALAFALPAFGQQPPTARHLAFDVVSIRPSGATEHAGIGITPDGFRVAGMPLASTILLAYFPPPYFKHFDDLKNAPSWVTSENYDIEARVSAEDLPAWKTQQQPMMRTAPMLQAMLQTLLAERFHLVVHPTPQLVEAYALTLGKGKLKLEPDTTGEVPNAPGMKLLEGGRALAGTEGDHPSWAFANTSIPALLGFLSFNATHPLVDQTGLTGKYRFTLNNLRSGASPDEYTDPDPLVPFDLDSVGLKLVRTKVSATTWVIDSIDRPTPN